jgi:periplasmic divalent cation tolerance protein
MRRDAGPEALSRPHLSPLINMSRVHCCSIYCTTATHDDALRIGRALVEERLAACANAIGGMTSVYRWEGEIQQDSEAVLLVKTRQELRERTIERIRELHEYDVPCVVSWDIAAGNADYLKWIAAETLPPA